MSEWLRDSLAFCRTYWWAIVALVVPIAALREFILINLGWNTMAAGINAIPPGFLWGMLTLLLLESFLQISLILLVQGVLSKQDAGIAQRSSRALVMMLPFIMMQLMMGFGVAAGAVAFIVPGIYILVRWLLAPYFLLLQNQGALASLKSSWQYSRGYAWDLFFGLLITTLVSLAPTVFMLDAANNDTVLLSNAVLSILSSVLGAWSVVLFYRAFDYVQANPRFID